MSVELSTLGSVIKTAYEGESDTNAYTDAEKTKLSGIESGATNDTLFTRGTTISSNYTLTSADFAGGVYKDVDTSGGNITITVPVGLDGIPPSFENTGSNVVTFQGDGTSTVNARNGVLTLTDQYSVATVVPKGSDTYTLVGGLA